MATASGTFEVQFAPPAAELGGVVGRMAFTKTFVGDLAATSSGLLLSGGDPGAGSAGYVAVEDVRGTLDGREGTFLFHQLGTMDAGHSRLTYEVVPGSGTGGLAGLTGVLDLTVDDDGTHHYQLTYERPGDP